MPMVTRCLSALLLAAATTSAAAEGWTRTSDVGRDPVNKTTREQYDLSATGRVEVSEIGGSVQVRAGDGSKVELAYERRAATQRDFDCETLKIEQNKDGLRIWVEHKRERACRVVRADDELTLTVPRGASVTIRGVGDEVDVEGVEGLVRISDVGNRVTLTGTQEVDARDIGNSIELSVTRLGAGGIRIEDIGNSVELTLPEKLDARVHIASVGNKISGPGLRLNSDDDDYQAQVGAGGPLIRVEDIGNSVKIHGPRLPQPEREDRRSRDSNDY